MTGPEVAGPTLPKDASTLAAGVASGLWSAREVVDDFLARVHRDNGELNALVAVRAEGARADADALDRAHARGERLGPLAGVPFTVKDVLATRDLPTTCGSRAMRPRLTTLDATVVSRLRSAGALLIGKTNCPEFAFGIDTDNLAFGRTRNPLGRFIVGGSSGGEAAALAAGFSALGVGTDFGGSLRWPAQCTRTVGLRPTVGRIPATGTLPALTDAEPSVPFLGSLQGRLQTVGPMATNVADLRAGLGIMAGADGYDPQAVPVPFAATPELGLVEVRGGSPAGENTQPEVDAAVRWALDVLTNSGAVVCGDLPIQIDGAIELYARLREWEGLEDIRASVVDNHDLTPLVRSLIAEPPRADRSDVASTWVARDRLRGELLRWLRGNRVLILPVANVLPLFDHEPTDSGFEILAPSRAVALFGLPALSVPCPRAPDGRPVSVQVVGPPFREDLVLAVGEALERAASGDPHARA